MAKVLWRPGNMLYPLPVVMVSLRGLDEQKNIITIAWTGTVCSDPPMVSISVRPERHSWKMLMDTREFVINLTTRKLAYATDFCGVKSGRDIDKFKELNLTAVPGVKTKAPMIAESPVNIECRVTQVISLGTHDMFLAKVAAVHADEQYLDEKGSFHLEQADPIVYSHGAYLTTGERIGSFGYSVRKENRKEYKKKQQKRTRGK